MVSLGPVSKSAFTKATGIKVNFTEQPDQDAMYAGAKVSLETGSIDVIEPTLDRVSAWNSNGLLQGWDSNKLALDNYSPGLADGSAGERATIDGKRFFVPSVWGTEAMVYSKEGLNDVAHAEGCCCCGGNEIASPERVNVNVFTYAVLY
jgi:spermidine/putrescine-binding protein